MTIEEAVNRCRQGAIVAWFNAILLAFIIILVMATGVFENAAMLLMLALSVS